MCRQYCGNQTVKRSIAHPHFFTRLVALSRAGKGNRPPFLGSTKAGNELIGNSSWNLAKADKASDT